MNEWSIWSNFIRYNATFALSQYFELEKVADEFTEIRNLFVKKKKKKSLEMRDQSSSSESSDSGGSDTQDKLLIGVQLIQNKDVHA